MSAYLPAWPWALLAVSVVIAAVTDLRCGKVFNWLTYPMILVGVFAHAVLGGWGGGSALDPKIGVLGSLLGILWCWPLFAAWMMGGIGGGDVKLQAGVGALAGWAFAMSVLFYGMIAAAVLALIVMIYRRRTKRTFGRVFRFLALAAVKARPADPAAPDSPTIPFAFAMCLGTVAAGVEWFVTGEFADYVPQLFT